MSPKRLKESILGDVGYAAQQCPLPRHIFIALKPSMDKIDVGSFYEVNHSNLPPKTPSLLLHSIRVVMVTAKTELNVTVRYPSTESLEAHFGNTEHLAYGSKLYPELDEKYVMGPKLAVEVLGRQIPSTEFVEFRRSKNFWLRDFFEIEQFPSPVSVWDVDARLDSTAKNGPLLLKLRGSRIKGWGYQRVVAYLRDPKQPDDSLDTLSVLSQEGKEIIPYDSGEKEEERNEIEGKETVQYKEKEDEKVKNEVKERLIQYSRKKKQDRLRHSPRPKKEIRNSLEPKCSEPKARIKKKEDLQYIDRWPVTRYETAATKLLGVLKARGAVYGNSISRFQLREEARKEIGDTGLLDHLLKHLAGKVMPGQSERLRRRCDAEGKMEYWLESADLVEIRKKAGVQDPYWTPPPGWKLGDCIAAHNCLCCQQVKEMKEELSSMRRQMAESKCVAKDEQVGSVAVQENAAYSERLIYSNLNGENSKETYELLLMKKSIMEDQLLEVSKALMEFEEGMKFLTYKAEEAAEHNSLALVTSSSLPEEMNEMSITGIEDMAEGEGGELSESNGDAAELERQAKRARVAMKIRPCRNLLALTPASVSPISTTTF